MTAVCKRAALRGRLAERLLAALALLEISASHASAQQQTTATYEDWTVSCSGTPKVCELTSLQKLTGQSNPASQITISGVAKEKPLKVSIQIPPNVWLASGVRVAKDETDAGVVATFRWCVPSRCLADVDLDDKTLRTLGDRVEDGALKFLDASRQNVKIPVSFKGFIPAIDAFWANQPRPR